MRCRGAVWLLAVLLACGTGRAQRGPFDTGPRGGTQPNVLPRPGSAPSEPGSAKPKPSDKPAEKPKAPETEFYGNALPGTFGGKPWTERPELPIGQAENTSYYQSRRVRGKLNRSGYADLNYSFRSVSGAAQTFSQDQYGKDQDLAFDASLFVSGPIWKWANLNVNAQVEQRSFGFNDTKPVWRIFWADQNNTFTIGDISPSLGDSNEFVPFSRRMKGLQADGRIGSRFEYLLFGSQVEGSIRNETFVGDGTAGPYFLTNTPIVDGSAVVVVDGVIQQPGYGDNGDYTLNPSTGELLFNGARIIPPTSRIEVRYETQGSGGPKDLLLGARISYNPGRRFRLGVSYLGQIAAQKGGPSGPVQRHVTDTITVPTPSNGPFTIMPRPIVAESEAVQVNGILQERDVDYQINYTTGELRFFQLLPEGTNILVRFSVIEQVDLGAGDRNIFGVDGSFSLGKIAAVQFEFAQSAGVPSSRSNPFSFGGSGSFGYGSGDTFGGNPYGSGTYGGGGYGGGYGGGGYGGGFGGSGGFGGGLNTGYSSGFNSGFGTGNSGGNSGGFGSNLGGFSGGSGTFNRAAGGRAVWGGYDPIVQPTRQSGSQQPSGSGGQAYKVSFASGFGGFQFSARYKSVSDNFSRIDSTGFFQNERGYGFQAQYSSGPRFAVAHQFDSYTRPYYTTLNDELVVSRVSSVSNVSTLTWRMLRNTSITLLRNDQSNGGGGSNNKLSRSGVQFSHRFGAGLSFNAGFDHASSSSGGVVTGTSQRVNNNSSTNSGRFGLSWSTKSGRLGARVDYNFSGTSSALATNSAKGTVFSFNYQPWRWMNLQVSHQLSDSHNETRSLRQAGTGVFDDNGDATTVTDPLTGGNLTSTTQDSKTQNTSLSASITPNSKLNLTGTWSHGVSDNGRLAGSSSNSFMFNAHYQLSEALGLGAGYNMQLLNYTSTGDHTTTGIFNANLDWRVSNHLDLRFDFQNMGTRNRFSSETASSTTGLSPSTAFRSWAFDARWRLPGRSGHTLFTTFRGDSSHGGGSADFGRTQFSTGLDFRLTDIIGARLSYDFTSYKNTAGTIDNSYSANLFNLGIGARF
ncbi:MAG: hypothetical protein HYU66_08670 [Armatimonadetes bacterium]|nr:hypothetical protein [Armatimonadota bacterium]